VASEWFAARPSGTGNIYKIYAENFRDEGHLDEIVSEAEEIVHHALASTAGKS
jgi:phosphoglucomutase